MWRRRDGLVQVLAAVLAGLQQLGDGTSRSTSSQLLTTWPVCNLTESNDKIKITADKINGR